MLFYTSNSVDEEAVAAATFVASVTSALASIPSNLDFKASVKLFCVNPPSPTV